ncbi:hypothetical protein [Branchiibius sp. NY16-3462-2]|uniref:NACHT domain-containing protein n=1 Tax=Branchiibius sp. NY16-3462-2 TaxID=1807500 RepID=UPI00079CB83C|nr:hypothetical protein [Branchiibius sp. NY16-3462-2]KYH45440.1 hypothetical protein AZH51_16060 [Branchiibius sp. NY16-3462-2]
MTRHDLQRLGPVGLQDFVAAVALNALGSQVRPMGSGKDGGRDLLADGRLKWSAGSDDQNAEVWEGTTVFQVKNKETLEGTTKDQAWFQKQVLGELKAWADPDSGRREVPDYLVFATNVRLTPVPGSGGFDAITDKINEYLRSLNDEAAEQNLAKSRVAAARKHRHARRDRMHGLRKFKIWDGNQLDGYLDAFEGIRRNFDAFLTAGDVLADLSWLSDKVDPEHLGSVLRDHARHALLSERRIYFDEAGSPGSKGVPVEDVVIDLPALASDPPKLVPVPVIRYVMERGEHLLRPRLTTIDRPRHVIVTGAPGNGKSTVAKFLTHAYRSAFVDEADELGEEHAAVVAATNSALRRLDLRPPANRRWPVNVDLAAFAKEYGFDGGDNLLRWISERLTKLTSAKTIPPWVLHTWLKRWPSIVILDGLDEVTEPSVRAKIVGEIEALTGTAETENWDVLLVVTTRPTGYTGELPETSFERVDLTDLPVQDALQYGRVVTALRIPDDDERRERIVSSLERAAEDERTRHLLRTPLQTLIMSIIAETSPQISPSRFALFWGYYLTVEKREQTKQSGLARLLTEHSQLILKLHRQVGLRLQELSEAATGFVAVLSPEELKATAWQVLHEDEFDLMGKDAHLLDRIMQAVTHRLVLLAPRADDGYGFDVRSLQELMAALALTTGSLEETLPRLRAIAPSPHWRNTLLFAAGRYFFEQQPHEHEAVKDLVLTLDADAPTRLGSAFPVGPEIAPAIVNDGMVRTPKHFMPLLAHALQNLYEPALDLPNYTRMLMAAATEAAARDQIGAALRSALYGSAVSHLNAEQVRLHIPEIGRALGVPVEVLGLASAGPAVPVPPVRNRTADWSAFSNELYQWDEPDTHDRLRVAMEILKRTEESLWFEGTDLDDLLRLVDDPDIAFVLDRTLRPLIAGSYELGAALRLELMASIWRRPVQFSEEP